MNIGIIHGFVGGGGGIEKTLYGIFDALEQTEHDVTLYTFSKPKLAPKKFAIKSTLPFSIPAFGLYQRAMESRLISKAKSEDLLIQASGGLGVPVTLNQKIIIYCHGDFANESKKSITKYKKVLSLYYKSYYTMLQKSINGIQDSRIHLLSNSVFTQNSIQSKHKKSSTVLYPPIDLNEFYPKNKENKVVTVGRFSEEKNFDFGIDVMKNIDSKYEIIGNTKTKSNELYYKKLQSTVSQNSMCEGGVATLLKNISRLQLVEHLSDAKVYLHCSEETLGISVIEAISAGCIPIVPNNSAHLETVPVEELRYDENNKLDAAQKIKNALNGDYDKHLGLLKENAKKFSKDVFMQGMIKHIEMVSLKGTS